METKFGNNTLPTGRKETPHQYRMIVNNNPYAVELVFYLCDVVGISKIRPMVVELLQLEVGVHGWCASTIQLKLLFAC